MAKTPIKFKEIPYNDVPFREPRTRPSGSPGKSQWDDALAAIKRGWARKPKRAIQIVEPDSNKRKALKSTLITMARKRSCIVEVLDSGDSVYACGSDRESVDRCFR
jgi:hypothetical protein